MSNAPEDGSGLTVTVGRPWNRAVDGPPPSADQLRPYLDARQREFLEQFRRTGEHLHNLLVVAVEGCPPPAGWRPADDANVRGCLYALTVCRDLTRRADGYSDQANQSLRIEAGGSLSLKTLQRRQKEGHDTGLRKPGRRIVFHLPTLRQFLTCTSTVN